MIISQKKIIQRIIIASIILCTLIIISNGLSAVSAVEINNTTSGGIKTNIQNNTILELTNGTYTGSNNTNITINNGKNITIQSKDPENKATIDCQGSWFINNNGNLTLINLIIQNAYQSEYGGAIYNTHYLTIINCTFINNTANSGGAILNIGDGMSVIDSTFNGNTVTSTGGAIMNYGDGMSVIGSTFTGNTANSGGGAIMNTGNGMSVIGSTFTGNIATSGGGAIYNWNNVNMSVINSTFTNNIATNGYGGVIYNSGVNMSVINSTFTGNNANQEGGAIYNIDGANMSVIGSTFTDNTANSGGAIRNNVTDMNVSDSTFNNNTATNGSGGAILNTGNSMSVSDSIFNNNTATNGNGGAIRNMGDGVSVYDSNFTHNNASYGGGIYNSGNMLVFANLMANNSASISGNVIYNNGSMNVLNLTYMNNNTQLVYNGQKVTLFATLTDDMGNPITGQKISFYLNGTHIGSVESIEGYANMTYKVKGVGGDILTVNGTYNGAYNPNILTGELKIKLTTNSTISAPNTKVGKSINITGVVTDELGNLIHNTEIIVAVNGINHYVTTNNLGEWSLLFTPQSDGIFNVVVSWIGNDSHLGFNNNTQFYVEKASDNKANDTNNSSIKTNDNSLVSASMKKTGIPVNLVLLVFLSVLSILISRKI